MKKKVLKDKLNILYIFHTKHGTATWYYRVFMPKRQFEKAGHTVVVSHSDNTSYNKTRQEWKNLLKKFDMVIGKNIQADYTWDMVRFVTQELGIPLISDFDDYVHDIDSKNEQAKVFAEGTLLKTITNETLKYSDGLIVSTEKLKEMYKDDNKNIWVLPNLHEKKLYQRTKPVVSNDAIWLYWAGSPTHQSDLEVILPAIRYVMDKYENVSFCTVMGHPKNASRFFTKEQMENRWLRLPGVPTFKEYPSALANSPATIGLLPLADNVFNKGKSPIKFYEYTERNLPVIASDVGPYKIIKNVITGIKIPNTTEDWIAALELLIEEPEFRAKLNKRAKEELYSVYSYENNIKLFNDTLLEIYNTLK